MRTSRSPTACRCWPTPGFVPSWSRAARSVTPRSSPPRRARGSACTSPGHGISSTEVVLHESEDAVSARILDGKATAAAIKAELAERVARLAAAGRVPGLGTVLVGDDPGSHAYVNGKHRDSLQVGIASIRRELPADASQEQVEA